MKLIVGNWKMNGLRADGIERMQKLTVAAAGHKALPFQMVLCPPSPHLSLAVDHCKNSVLRVGAQDCHAEASGAFTGDISAEMIKDTGVEYVIVGHSERRQGHKETSEVVAAKAAAAHRAGLIAIICVGETDAERSSGNANNIVADQIKKSLPLSVTSENTVVAYEPVWAIGTGKTASADDIKNMHAFIRTKVSEQVDKGAWLPLLYGGSVKAANAAEILATPNVDGVLVGGASLKADEFWAIAQASQ